MTLSELGWKLCAPYLSIWLFLSIIQSSESNIYLGRIKWWTHKELFCAMYQTPNDRNNWHNCLVAILSPLKQWTWQKEKCRKHTGKSSKKRTMIISTNDMTLKYSNIVGCSSLYEKKKKNYRIIRQAHGNSMRKQVALTFYNWM